MILPDVALLTVLLLAAAGVDAATATISSSTNLTAAQTALYTNADVTVSGAGTVLTLYPSSTVGVLAQYCFNSLTVASNATVYCVAQTNATTLQMPSAVGVAIWAAADVNVMTGGNVNAVGQGFYNGGPGYGVPGRLCSGAAGHGGCGGDALPSQGYPYSAGGPGYGSVTNPTTLGSGGEVGWGSGAIKITAGGTLTVDGLIDVKAPTNGVGLYYDYSGGAGGSIWIQAGTLAGAGTIRADGGDCLGNFNHGGGGGGRIALYRTTDAFDGKVTAYGGAPVAGSLAGYGAAGTIFKKLDAQPNGVLIVDNNGRTPTGLNANATYLGSATDSASYTFGSIVLTNAGCLAVTGSETLNVGQNTIWSDGSGQLAWTAGQGTLALPSAYVVSNLTLVLNNGTPAGLTSLTVLTNSWISHFPNATSESYRVNLTLDALTVNAGGGVLVSGKGYLMLYGPGLGGTDNYHTSSGAGHGGRGGAAFPSLLQAIPGGGTYGSYNQPTNCGSGGIQPGPQPSSSWISKGGGAAKLTVNSTLTVNGAILADGGDGTGNYWSGGAGGSLWLVAQTFTGNGMISAKGGDYTGASAANGGSGGGRIAIYATNNTFAGTLRAIGGNSNNGGGEKGAAGTIFLKAPSQTYGELRVDNSNTVVLSAAAQIGTNNDGQTYTFDQVTLVNRGRLAVQTGQTLQVLGAPNPNIVGDATGSGMLVNNGTVQLPTTCVLTNFSLANNNAASLGSLQDLTLGGAATLTHSRNWTNAQYRLNLTLNSLTIATNARVSADACGFVMGYGPGAPVLYQSGTPITNASYGGVGWGNTNALYGNPYAPTDLGSGGTGYWNLSLLGDPYAFPCGGGAIQLKVRNALTVNGTISAGPNYSGYYAGAGSGGSIWLDAGTLAGSGVIQANGGPDGDYSANGSGGGRIAIYTTHHTLANFPTVSGLFTNRQDLSANILVTGGYNTSANGPEDGSIYIYNRPFGTVVSFQ
jgi:hypothetical protein